MPRDRRPCACDPLEQRRQAHAVRRARQRGKEATMVSAMQGAGGVGRPGNPWLGYGSGSARSRGGCAYRTGPRQDVRGETGGLHDDRSDGVHQTTPIEQQTLALRHWQAPCCLTARRNGAGRHMAVLFSCFASPEYSAGLRRHVFRSCRGAGSACLGGRPEVSARRMTRPDRRTLRVQS